MLPGLKARNDDLQREVNSLKENLDQIQNELGVSNANLDVVAHELDSQKAQNDFSTRKIRWPEDKEASLEEQIKRLMEKSVSVAADEPEHQDIVAVKGAETKQGPRQTVMWVKQDSRPDAGREVIQNFLRGDCCKKDSRVECAALQRRLLPGLPKDQRQGSFDLYRKRA